MKQVMFEANENVSTSAVYWVSKDDLKGYVKVQYLNSSFIVTLPSGAELPTEEELEKGIEISAYVDWESVENPSNDNTFSLQAHVFGKTLTTQQYNMFAREMRTLYGAGGMERLVASGWTLEDEEVFIEGSTQMTVGEEIVNAPVEETNEEVTNDSTGE